jgi:hypothetical protein
VGRERRGDGEETKGIEEREGGEIECEKWETTGGRGGKVVGGRLCSHGRRDRRHWSLSLEIHITIGGRRERIFAIAGSAVWNNLPTTL